MKLHRLPLLLVLLGLAHASFPSWHKASYIGGHYNSSLYKFGPGGLLRTRFVAKEISSATVYLAVNGIAEVYVDGQRAGGSGQGRRVLEPVLSQWEKRMFYIALDVAHLLDSNQTHHTLGIALGRGHWSHYQYGDCGAMVQLVVNNQSLVVSSSDGDWYSHPGPILDDDLFNGEIFDGRIAAALGWHEKFAGWASSGAKATGWHAIRSTSTTFYRPPLLTSQRNSGIAATVTSAPLMSRNIIWLTKKSCVIDFGENGAGWTRLIVRNDVPQMPLSVKGSQGVQITLAHGEMIDPRSGDLFNQFPCPVPSRVCVNQTDRYTCSGEQKHEVYEPRFTWHGYRYVKVTGCLSVIMPGGRISRSSSSHDPSSWACELFAIRVGTNFSAPANNAPTSASPPTSPTSPSSPTRLTFPSSPLLTSISSMIERTMLSNQIGYQTSCPQREKVAWTGDSLATAKTLLLVVGHKDGVPYLRNYVRHLADNFDMSFDTNAPNATIDDTVPHLQFQGLHANTTDGTITSFPSSNGSWPGDNGGWTPVFPLTVLLLYETDGDASFVQQYYARLKSFTAKTMEMCGSVPPPPVQSGQSKCGFYGDWSNPIVRFATTQDTGRMISTAYTILQLDAMAKMAQVIGVEKDRAMYANMASQQRRLFDSQYWNETTLEYGYNHTFVQVTSILALRVLYWDSSSHSSHTLSHSSMFVPNATRQKQAKEALLGDIKARGGQHSVGLIGWTHLFHVLSSIDANDVAVDLLESEEYPSLGYMLKRQGKGSTLWERWDLPDASNPAYISSENSTSLNHPMFGSVYDWLVQHKDDIDARLLSKRKREQHTVNTVASRATSKRATPMATPMVVPKRKNVLYMLADDMRADWGSYGLPVHTPNLDRLVEEGLRFDHAYCQISVCSPSRQSFMTSRRPDTNKVWNFIDANPLTTQAIPGYFRDHGYLSLGLGKTFHENQGAWNADKYWNTSVRPYFPYESNQCPQVGGTQGTPTTLPTVPPHHWPCGTAGGGQCISKDQHIWDYTLRMKSMEYLKYAANHYKNTSQPFFLMTGFRDPHAPWDAPQRMYDLYNVSAIQTATHQTLGTNVPLIAWSKQLNICLANGTSFPYTYDQPVPNWVQQNQRHAYYAAVSYVDEHIGAVLQVLKDERIENDTIVVFHADHGYALGEHGEWEKKSNMDLIVRVPMVIKVPGITDADGYNNGNHSTAGLVDLVDVFPTVASLAGLPLPKNVDGMDQSFLIHATNSTSNKKQYAYHQYPACGMETFNQVRMGCNQVPANQFNYMGYSLRSVAWRYTVWYEWNQDTLTPKFNESYVEELYNHVNDDSRNMDEWENVNVVEDHLDVATIMRKEVERFFFS